MPYVSKQEIARAKEMDLLTYLQNYEPWELKHIKGDVYQTVSHDSLKISNGKWMWWSKGIGGRSALDYLIKVRGMEFTEAVTTINGNSIAIEPIPIKKEKVKKESLVIPTRNISCEKTMQYLIEERALDKTIVMELYDKGIWYETSKYHNVAFVGKDLQDNIKLVTLRSIYGDFKNTTSGSDRHFPVRLVSESIRNNVVHIFEAPIDMLSYLTLMKQMGTDYKRHNFLALCGIYQAKENIEESSVPIGIQQYITDYSYTKTVCLHLDNDGPGKKAAVALEIAIKKLGIDVINQPPPRGYKDCNDFLCRGSATLSIREKHMERG